MKVLFLSSASQKKYHGIFSILPYVSEQAKSLIKKGLAVDHFLIRGSGLTGYLSNLPLLKKKIDEGKYDILHAHYGLSGMLGVLQRKVPTVITYHGSDITKLKHRLISMVAMLFADYNIFVSQKIAKSFSLIKKKTVIPCGVDFTIFFPMDKLQARKHLNLNPDKKYILFAGDSSDANKNFPLAKQAIEGISMDIKIIDLNGLKREEICLLMNACDLMVMTSFKEGSPQTIKEALACNLPVISVDVGDVKERIRGIKNCYIVKRDPNDILEKILAVFQDGCRANNAYENISYLSNDVISEKILCIYTKVLSNV